MAIPIPLLLAGRNADEAKHAENSVLCERNEMYGPLTISREYSDCMFSWVFSFYHLSIWWSRK